MYILYLGRDRERHRDGVRYRGSSSSRKVTRLSGVKQVAVLQALAPRLPQTKARQLIHWGRSKRQGAGRSVFVSSLLITGCVPLDKKYTFVRSPVNTCMSINNTLITTPLDVCVSSFSVGRNP